MLATYTVNVDYDAAAPFDFNDNIVTLREAVFQANQFPGQDTIVFDPSLNGATITLGKDEQGNSISTGELIITESVTITGPGAELLTIDASGNDLTPASTPLDSFLYGNDGDGSRIFNFVEPDLTASISGLTLTGGDVHSDANGGGGAIRALGIDLTLSGLIIKDNFATRMTPAPGNEHPRGGGVFIAGGNVTITDTIFDGNISGYRHNDDVSIGKGGGLYVVVLGAGDVVTISNSQFLDNIAGDFGGGLYVVNGISDVSDPGEFTLQDSIVSGNSADFKFSDQSGFRFWGDGGGVYAQISFSQSVPGTNRFLRNDISYNSASRSGGGMYLRVEEHFHFQQDPPMTPPPQVVDIRDTTLHHNVAYSANGELYSGGGGLRINAYGHGETAITNTTISTNRALNGGGIFLEPIGGIGGPGNRPSTIAIRHSTITGNTAGPILLAEGFPLVPDQSRDPQVTSGGGLHISHSGFGLDSDELPILRIDNTILAANNHVQNEPDGTYFTNLNYTPDIGSDHSLSNFSGIEPPVLEEPEFEFWGEYSIFGLLGGPFSKNVLDLQSLNDENFFVPLLSSLGPLVDNGGFLLPDGSRILTHEPQVGSEAIDAGDPEFVPPPDFDQRGDPFTRVYNDRIDIGAVEVQPPPVDLPPQIVDVLLYGVMPNDQPWEREPYSYAEIVPTGKQLAPIYTDGVNTIQIAFSEHVNMAGDGSALTLHGSNGVVFDSDDFSFDYDMGAHLATWTFHDPLPGDKYRLKLSALDVLDAGDNPLDGDWDNLMGPDANAMPTPDNFDDDAQDRELQTGNGAAGGDFRFLFSLLPGDYNQDGVVLDEGPNSDLDSLADGNGDGVIDSDEEGADGDVVTAHRLEYLPASKAGGDYYDNELVDPADGTQAEIDYMVWRDHFGETGPNLLGDGNHDDFVDAGDYSIWRDHEFDYSAWYMGEPPGGGSSAPGGPYVQFGVAPQVVNVTISGSESLHDPYSFENVVGSGQQLRTVPVGGADTISITFSEDVNVSAGSLDLVGLYTAYRPELLEFIYDLGTMTATWRFEFIEQGDLYLVSLSDAVTDVEGDHLDGEWVNPASLTTTNAAVSEFPSGNGEGGGDFNFVVALLPGDANLNLQVNGSDYMIIGPYYFMGQPGAEFVNGDFNGDGVVTSADIALFQLNYGTNLQSVWVLADLDSDFMVDQADLDLFYDNWAAGLENPTVGDGDLNGDGEIDLDDVDLMFAQFGLELAVVS